MTQSCCVIAADFRSESVTFNMTVDPSYGPVTNFFLQGREAQSHRVLHVHQAGSMLKAHVQTDVAVHGGSGEEKKNAA